MREIYDDFGVCSDYDSDCSWISYPPPSKLQKDVYMQAQTCLFSEKIKYKFQYDNCLKSILPDKIVVQKLEMVTRRTQTAS